MSFYSLAGSKKTYKSYIINKILTLFPLYCFFIIVCLLVGEGYSLVNFNDAPQKINVVGIILNALFLHEFSAKYINTVVPGGWFLATIWIYYLIVPLLFKVIKTLSRSVKFAFGALCIRILTHLLTHLLTRYCDFSVGIVNWIDMTILNHLVFLSIGQVLYFILFTGDKTIDKWDIFCAFASTVYIALQLDNLMFWTLIIVMFILIIQLMNGGNIFTNGFFVFIGKFSFEFYLCHEVVIYVLMSYLRYDFGTSIVNYLIYFALTFVITLSASVCIGKIMRMVKKKVNNSLTNKLG